MRRKLLALKVIPLGLKLSVSIVVGRRGKTVGAELPVVETLGCPAVLEPHPGSGGGVGHPPLVQLFADLLLAFDADAEEPVSRRLMVVVGLTRLLFATALAYFRQKERHVGRGKNG